MSTPSQPSFAPQLYISNGVTNIDFYTHAFGAVETMRFSNDDGSVHVAELSIEGALFYVHEETAKTDHFSPQKHNGTTVIVALFVDDVHAFFNKAIAAGAEEISPVQDYDYGYRQGDLKDPFGHQWMIQKKI